MTGGKASFEELVRLREACAVYEVDGKQYTWPRELAAFCEYAFENAVTLLEQERAHSDRLAEALDWALDLAIQRCDSAAMMERYQSYRKLLAEHAKLRGAQ